ERHVELFRAVEDRVEPFVRQIITAHVGGDMSSDETEVSNATTKLRRSRDRILHGQECPGRKSPGVRGDELGKAVVGQPRDLYRELWIEMVIDQRRGEREHGAVNFECIHPPDLAGRIKKAAVESEMHTAHREIDALVILGRHDRIEFLTRQYVAEGGLRDEMAMDVRDHVTVPNTQPSAARP